MKLMKNGYDEFQINKSPGNAFACYKQAIDLASGFVKSTALVQAAYMSYLMGNRISDFHGFIKDALAIDPEIKLEAVDFSPSFRRVFDDIKRSGANAAKPVVVEEKPVAAAAKPVTAEPPQNPAPTQAQPAAAEPAAAKPTLEPPPDRKVETPIKRPEKNPTSREETGLAPRPARKRGILPIIVGVTAAGALAAWLLLVVFRKPRVEYDITGNWTIVLTTHSTAVTSQLDVNFIGSSKNGNFEYWGSTKGTYKVDGKNVAINFHNLSFWLIGEFNIKDHMAGTTSIADMTWDAVRISGAAANPPLPVALAVSSPTSQITELQMPGRRDSLHE